MSGSTRAASRASWPCRGGRTCSATRGPPATRRPAARPGLTGRWSIVGRVSGSAVPSSDGTWGSPRTPDSSWSSLPSGRSLPTSGGAEAPWK
eukprot:6369935-Lingulodinium_polyedra.AAC.1